MVSVKINLNQNLSMLGFLTLSDHWGIFVLFIIAINIGNRNECSPIQPVILRVINKIGQPRSGSPICQSRVWLHTELSTRSRQCCQLIKTRHRLYVFLGQKRTTTLNSAKCATTVCTHDAHCPYFFTSYLLLWWEISSLESI